MAVRTQLSVTMENKPGALAGMCSAFGERRVNILAFASSAHEGKSLVRMIVDKPPVARRALQAIGYAYTQEQVLGSRPPNRPGTLAAVAKRLGDAAVNIDYAYSGVEPGSSQQLVVLSVSDLGRGRRLVK